MKKVQAYKCDFCSKTSTNASALFQHERKCRNNPNNKHKCFDFCKHLKMKFDSDCMRKTFICELTGTEMYSYKAEYRGMNHFLPSTRMPLQCEKHQYTQDWLISYDNNQPEVWREIIE